MGKFWISFGFSILASIFLVLTCEAPVIAVEKMLFSKSERVKAEIPVKGPVIEAQKKPHV